MKPLRVEERHNSFSVDEQSHEAEKSSTKTSSTAKGRVWLEWFVCVIIGSVKRHLFRKRRWESVKQKNVQTTRRSRNYFPAGDSRHSINSGMNTSLRMASHALNGLSSSAVFIDAMCVLDVVIALHQTSAPDWRNNRVNNNLVVVQWNRSHSLIRETASQFSLRPCCNGSVWFQWIGRVGWVQSFSTEALCASLSVGNRLWKTQPHSTLPLQWQSKRRRVLHQVSLDPDAVSVPVSSLFLEDHRSTCVDIGSALKRRRLSLKDRAFLKYLHAAHFCNSNYF